MSTSTSYAAGVLTTQYDYTKFFVFGNRFRTATYTNSTGSTVTLTTGTVLGRVYSSNKVLPQVSTATDGSQVPIGFVRGTYAVANGATVTVTYCYTGDIDPAGIVFGGSDTLATVITLNDSAGTPNTTKVGTIEQLLVDRGLNPVISTDLTYPDN